MGDGTVLIRRIEKQNWYLSAKTETAKICQMQEMLVSILNMLVLQSYAWKLM